MDKYSIRFAERVSRHPDILADQLMVGIVNGGMFGKPVMIERRDRGLVVFRCTRPLLYDMPEYGEVRIAASEGESEVVCMLRCRGMTLRALALGMLLGLLVGAVVGLYAGWLWGVPAALLSWIGPALALRAVRLGRLATTARAFVLNLRYLKTT